MCGAMSIANAMKVRRVVMKVRNDMNRTSVICDERENRILHAVEDATAMSSTPSIAPKMNGSHVFIAVATAFNIMGHDLA